jgi:uncharacterized protein YdaU (DUF1376 family)
VHHYPFHPGDYLKDTAHWSEARELVQVEAGLLRDLAYRRLLDLYYGEEEPIPSKTRLVAIRIRMLKHEDIVASVLKEKFVLIEGFWRQKRADEVVLKYQHRAETSRRNGKLGGRPKTGSKPKKNPAGSKRVATKNHKPVVNTPLPPDGGALFDTFWSRYPKKQNKPASQRAFCAAMGYGSGKARATFEELMTGLTVHLGCQQWVKDRGEYVPLASSWLNADGWNDRPLPHEAKPGANGEDKGWWETRQGLMDRAVAHGIPPPADDSPQAFMRFKAALWVHAGDGPWWDKNDTAYPLAVRLRDEG